MDSLFSSITWLSARGRTLWTLPHPCWNLAWLDLVQVPFTQSQPLWVHVCNSPFMSNKYSFTVDIHYFSPRTFLHLFLNGPRALGRRLYHRCPIQGWPHYNSILPQSWAVKGLCVAPYPLQKEAFLMRIERCTHENKNNSGNGLLLCSFDRIIDYALP